MENQHFNSGPEKKTNEDKTITINDSDKSTTINIPDIDTNNASTENTNRSGSPTDSAIEVSTPSTESNVSSALPTPNNEEAMPHIHSEDVGLSSDNLQERSSPNAQSNEVEQLTNKTQNVEEKCNDVEFEDEDDDIVTDEEAVVNASLNFSLSSEKNNQPSSASTAVTSSSSENGGVKVNLEVQKSSNREGSTSGEDCDEEDNAEETDDKEVLNPPSLPPSSTRRIPPSIKLPSTVTRLDAPNGNSLFLVGTAHFSKESQDDVANTIKLVRPDIIVVELCKARTAILSLDEETILEESRNLNASKIRRILGQHGVVQGILYILLLSVSAHVTKQLGMAPGGEFRTAFKESQVSTPGAKIVLGDRPIHITLSRALSSLTLWLKIKLAWHMLTSKDPISKEEVEKCKQRDFIEEMLAEMTGHFPAVIQVFVKERDVYLARSLQNAICYTPESPKKDTPSRIAVGVVGIGHVPGIVNHWGNVKASDIPPIMQIPPPSLTDKLIKGTFKYTFYGIIGYGIYKCLPQSYKQYVMNSVAALSKSAKYYLSRS